MKAQNDFLLTYRERMVFNQQINGFIPIILIFNCQFFRLGG